MGLAVGKILFLIFNEITLIHHAYFFYLVQCKSIFRSTKRLFLFKKILFIIIYYRKQKKCLTIVIVATFTHVLEATLAPLVNETIHSSISYSNEFKRFTLEIPAEHPTRVDHRVDI